MTKKERFYTDESTKHPCTEFFVKDKIFTFNVSMYCIAKAI